MSLTLRELQRRFLTPVKLGIYLAVAAVLIIVSPFGTDGVLSWPGRVAYWGGSALLICFLTDFVRFGTDKLIHSDNVWIKSFVNGAIMGAVVTVTVFLINHAVWGSDPNVPTFLQLLLIVLPISFVVSALIGFLIWNLKTKEQVTEIPFFRRLPHHLGRDLVCITAQDHYLEVVARDGSEMLLMRIGDAVAELEAYDGLQIHRSHWVAKDAVVGNRRQDGRLYLKLANDRELPVSRSFQNQVKAELRL